MYSSIHHIIIYIIYIVENRERQEEEYFKRHRLRGFDCEKKSQEEVRINCRCRQNRFMARSQTFNYYLGISW